MAAIRTARGKEVPPPADPRATLPRIRQVEWDHYYTEIALTVSTRANCTGSDIGAVLVRDNRIISTGFNGTPQGFTNCLDGGCVRCRDRELLKLGRVADMSYPTLDNDYKHFDLCICVHAEANALLAAARAGMRTDETTLYVTHKPCFSCLKEAVQAGVSRVVYLEDWIHSDEPSLVQLYELLAEHLRANDARNFEQLHRQSELSMGTGSIPRDPNLDSKLDAIEAEAKRKKTRDAAKARRAAKRDALAATKSPARARARGKSGAGSAKVQSR
jgi:dCMP deaminase